MRPKDSVVVASEKADRIADRIAAGVPASELELRKLGRFLREVAADLRAPALVRRHVRRGEGRADGDAIARRSARVPRAVGISA